MKHFVLCCIVLLSVFSVVAQKCKNYNPYQHAREEYLKILSELQEEYLNRYHDCELAMKLVQQYNDTNDLKVKKKLLNRITSIYCKENIPFYKNIIKNDTSEDNRCIAIFHLGGLLDKNDVDILYEHLKNDISDYEKVLIGEALYNTKNYKSGLKILNKTCYTTDLRICDKCLWCYYRNGGQEIINYLNFLFDSVSLYKYSAAEKLAEFGYHDKTRPLFIEGLLSTDEDVVIAALFGLATIGGKEDLEIIQKHTHDKRAHIAQRASFILKYIERKRRMQKMKNKKEVTL
mgnify:CR=1 FL=1